MARKPGAENVFGINDNLFHVTINNREELRIGPNSAVFACPIMSASISHDVYLTGVTGGFTIDDKRPISLIDSSAGSQVIFLPNAGTVVGQIFTVKKMDSSGNSTIISGSNSSQTIDGDVVKVLTGQYSTLSMVSHGGDWHIISYFSGGHVIA